MSYWWVNHKQTFKEELGGGYIWSPKRNKNGARNETYTNLTRTAIGDVIVSYAVGEIKAVGVVTHTCANAGRPGAFGQTGEQWDHDGWMVGVDWVILTDPVMPRMHLARIAPLLPETHSPIQTNGRGNQGCYLAAIGHDLGIALLDIASRRNPKLLELLAEKRAGLTELPRVDTDEGSATLGAEGKQGPAYLNGLNWNDITREERVFCAELVNEIRRDPDGFVSFLSQQTSGFDYGDGPWEVAFEACFYRDYLHRFPKYKKTDFPLKRTFDIALFGRTSVIVIEAKAAEGFTAKQSLYFERDEKYIQRLVGDDIDVHFVALASGKYFKNHRKFGRPKVLAPFGGRLITWESLEERYPESPMLRRAHEVYGRRPLDILDDESVPHWMESRTNEGQVNRLREEIAQREALLRELLRDGPGKLTNDPPHAACVIPLMYKFKGLLAKGRVTSQGFLVEAGSQIALGHVMSASERTAELRDKALDSGDLISKDDHFLLRRDLEFTSPSAAACFVSGNSRNGLDVWTDKSGRPLGQL